MLNSPLLEFYNFIGTKCIQHETREAQVSLGWDDWVFFIYPAIKFIWEGMQSPLLLTSQAGSAGGFDLTKPFVVKLY